MVEKLEKAAACPHCRGEGFVWDETACGDPEHCSQTYDCSACGGTGLRNGFTYGTLSVAYVPENGTYVVHEMVCDTVLGTLSLVEGPGWVFKAAVSNISLPAWELNDLSDLSGSLQELLEPEQVDNWLDQGITESSI